MDEDAPRVRTSLEESSSGFTREQIAARSLERCIDAYDHQGLVVVAIGNPLLNDWERQMLRNIVAKLRASLLG
jgi:hypothetical protein